MILLVVQFTIVLARYTRRRYDRVILSPTSRFFVVCTFHLHLLCFAALLLILSMVLPHLQTCAVQPFDLMVVLARQEHPRTLTCLTPIRANELLWCLSPSQTFISHLSRARSRPAAPKQTRMFLWRRRRKKGRKMKMYDWFVRVRHLTARSSTKTQLLSVIHKNKLIKNDFLASSDFWGVQIVLYTLRIQKWTFVLREVLILGN